MRNLFAVSLASSALVIAACSSSGKQTEAAPADTAAAASTPAAAPAHMHKAKADLEAKSGSKIKGTVMFEETTDGLKVSYDMSGLKAGKDHGFHVHEKGDCSSKDGKSAGPHYMKVADSPGTSKENPAKYAGDLPMIKADAKGMAKGEFVVKGLSVDQENPIKDRAIMVHGGPDDVKKPSAPRVACGVIKEAM